MKLCCPFKVSLFIRFIQSWKQRALIHLVCQRRSFSSEKTTSCTFKPWSRLNLTWVLSSVYRLYALRWGGKLWIGKQAKRQNMTILLLSQHLSLHGAVMKNNYNNNEESSPPSSLQRSFRKRPLTGVRIIISEKVQGSYAGLITKKREWESGGWLTPL